MKLTGKVALVTGASRGIGAAIAKRFAAEGAKVIVNYRSSEDKANALVQEITGASGEAAAIRADVSQLADVSDLISQAVDTYNGLDILVNNAGRAEFSPLAEITPEHVRKHFDLNVTGLIFTTQEAVRHMGEGGRIINMSSIAAKAGPSSGVYGATKAAVNALHQVLCRRVRAAGHYG